VTQGCPVKDARLVIGNVIIKHKLCLSDEETGCQIQENPYLQYIVGLPGYQMKVPLHLHWLLHHYWVIQYLYQQQWEMY
jgi:hypothetical protein